MQFSNLVALAAVLLSSDVLAAGLYTKGSAVLQVDNKNWQKLVYDSDTPSVLFSCPSLSCHELIV